MKVSFCDYKLIFCVAKIDCDLRQDVWNYFIVPHSSQPRNLLRNPQLRLLSQFTIYFIYLLQNYLQNGGIEFYSFASQYGKLKKKVSMCNISNIWLKMDNNYQKYPSGRITFLTTFCSFWNSISKYGFNAFYVFSL